MTARDKIPPEKLARILAYNQQKAEESRMANAGRVAAELLKLIPVSIIKPLLTQRMRDALAVLGVNVN